MEKDILSPSSNFKSMIRTNGSIVAVIMMILFIVVFLLNRSHSPISSPHSPMHLTSPAFSPNGSIPSLYTCEGENINPPLEIQDIPAGTQSLVLLMDDPDIPQAAKDTYHIEEWDHWVVYNMPPTILKIRQNSNPEGTLGINTRNNLSYGGPCPPDREHRYFFRLYALDIFLELGPSATKKEVLKAMEGHIIEMSELVGRYVKKNM